MPESVVTEPTAEPLSRDALKSHLRITHDLEDDYLDGLITSARRWVEVYLKRRLVTATHRLTLDSFYGARDCCDSYYYSGGEIRLPSPPLQSVSSVTYVDTNGSSTTHASSNYQADIYSQPGRVKPVYGQSWPSARCQMNAVTIQYVCGYGAASAVPANIVHAIKMYAGLLYEQREGTPDEMLAIKSLLDSESWGSI